MANFTARYPGQSGGSGGGGVTSLNSETGDLTLTAGTGIAITTPTSTTIQIASTSAGDVTIGAFGSTPNANGLSISGSQVLNMQPADSSQPGGVSVTTQSFQGLKSFVTGLLTADGTNSAPGLSFVSDTDTGLYRLGANDLGFAAGSFLGLEIKKSTGSFSNVGMGSAPSASDNYPLLLQRSNVSSGTYAQISNPDTSASSKATFQLATDLGANTGELSVFTAATATAAYAGSLVLRPSDSTLRLSLIGGDLAGGYVTTYTGGDYTSAGETTRFNADHTMNFMQSVTTPASPAAGLKFYNNAGVFSSKTTGGTVSSFTGVNTGDQASGNLTDVGTDGIVITGGTGAVLGSGTSIAQHVADTTHNGYLSSTDWNTFNGKQDTVSFAAVGSSPSANGGGISAGVITLQPFDATRPGLMTTGAQTAAGVKTFSSAPVMSALSASQAVVTDSGKALASLAYTNANTASTLVQRDGSGNFIAGTITAALTGTASGNTTYSANNHGVVISSATNAMTVIAPDSSTTKVLTSGGASADPTWGVLPGTLYASVYYPVSTTNYWTNANAGFADYSVTGTIPAPSTYVNAGFGTISKATSNLPGINFSAPRTGTIKMTVNVVVNLNTTTTNRDWALLLLESTTSTNMASTAGQSSSLNTNAGIESVTLVGYFAATASTTYNFKLQSLISGNTLYLYSAAAAGAMLSFQMNYIS